MARSWARFLRRNIYLLVMLAVAAGVLIEGAYERSRDTGEAPVEAVGATVKEVTNFPPARLVDKSSWIYLRDYVAQLVNNAAPSLALAGESRTTAIFVEPDLLLTSIQGIDRTESTGVELFDGTRRVGSLVGLDEEVDVALLRLTEGTSKNVLETSSLEDQLTWVVAVGLDEGRAPAVSVTLLSPATLANESAYLQGTHLELPHGAKGAAVLDFDGRLAGYYPPSSRGQILWADSLSEVVQRLKVQGRIRRPWIGLEVSELDPAVLEHLGVTSGLLVSSVFYRGPAWNAGARAGDLLVEINAQAPASAGQFRRVLASLSVGGSCELKLLRGGRQLTFKTMVKERSERQRLRAGGNWIPSLGASLRPERGVAASDGVRVSGLRVTYLFPDGAAFAAGIRTNDLILAVEGRPVLSAARLRRQILNSDSSLVELLRGERRLLLLLRKPDSHETP